MKQAPPGSGEQFETPEPTLAGLEDQIRHLREQALRAEEWAYRAGLLEGALYRIKDYLDTAEQDLHILTRVNEILAETKTMIKERERPT